MTLRLMYITNRPDVARIAEASGVDWVFVDLETLGKEERQGHLDTVISRHELDDVRAVKAALTTAQLLVRVNPIHGSSSAEIDQVIKSGADIVMLPFFTAAAEVDAFVRHVAGRARTCLLLETPQAVADLDGILDIEGIDFVHIGLNDLHLGYGREFMFELLADGTVDRLCDRLRRAGITFGFGGIARLGHGALPAEAILAEHHRLGSSMVILARSFCDLREEPDAARISSVFTTEVARIRDFEQWLTSRDEAFFTRNRAHVTDLVRDIVASRLGSAGLVDAGEGAVTGDAEEARG